MRGWCFWLSLAISLAPAATLRGQDAEGTLPARLGWADFSVVMGRISVATDRYQNMSTATGNEQTGERESFTVSLAAGQPSVKYELVSKREHIVCEATGSTQVAMLREPRGESKNLRVQYDQGPAGKITLTIGDDSNRRVYAADTLWHLLLAHPAVCKEHLLPLVAYMRSDWDLAETTAALEYSLLHTPESGAPAQRAAWLKLVAELNAPKFSARQAAERELRAQGLVVVPFLKEFNSRTLTSEQRQRVARVMSDVIGESDDTPERLAAWLAGDKQIWLTLLTRDSEECRQTAADRLSRLVNQPLNFDPTASTDARQKQIERLEKQWAGK